MGWRVRGAAVVVLGLILAAPIAHAAPTMHTHVDWTEGSFELGMAGAGRGLIPDFLQAPDHERIPVPVNPCHRQLSLGLEYHPRNASAQLGAGGNEAELILPYRFRAGLVTPNGTVMHRIVVDEPDLSIAFGTVPEAGTYTLELELLEGALVDWRVRVRGFAVDDPSCDVWLNEVESNPVRGGENWVELYNEGEQAVDISGWSLHAEAADTTVMLPDRTVLPAGGHRVIDVGEDALNDTNETVSLRGPTGASLETTPELTDPEADRHTWQKRGDGRGAWIFADGTPGRPNAN